MKRDIKTLEEAFGHEKGLINGVSQYITAKALTMTNSSFISPSGSIINGLCLYKSVRLTDKQSFSLNKEKYTLFNKKNKRIGLIPRVIKYDNSIEYINESDHLVA